MSEYLEELNNSNGLVTVENNGYPKVGDTIKFREE
jgi:hypothetical protein